jgi:hypothetical protein
MRPLLARFRGAPTYLENCGELTFRHYRQVWALTGIAENETGLLSMQEGREQTAKVLYEKPRDESSR